MKLFLHYIHPIRHSVLCMSLFTLTVAGHATDRPGNIDEQLRSLITQHQLTGNPAQGLDIPKIHSPKAQLGMKLFFSKTLGGDNTTACASCHHPLLGGGDNLSLSIGVDAYEPELLGSQRKLKNKHYVGVPRNAPTTFNVALYKRILFHDGRIERLNQFDIHTPDVEYPQADLLAGDTLVQAQARFPVTSVDEMRGEFAKTSFNQTLRRKLAKRLQKNWLQAFQKGFNQPNASAEELITEQNYSEAIAAYESSQVFINNPWKAYIEGDKTALNKSAKKGAWLFYTSQDAGGANCVSCHKGDFLTDELAHNTGMPQIGPGKGNGETGTNDYGCYLVTKKETDKFRFRTPSLLNVEVTGPWGHNGAYTSLESITRHMLDPLNSAQQYQLSEIKQNHIHLADMKKNTKEVIRADIDIKSKPGLKDSDIKHIVSFLKSLTDPCVKDQQCLSKWIPDKQENDPDGMMLHAKGLHQSY